MSRRKPPEVEWGAWGWDMERSVMVRHAADMPAPNPATISDDDTLTLVVARTGWWRTVPVRGEDWTYEWRHATGPARGAFHATMYIERAPRPLGCRPDSLCRPAVETMARLLGSGS